MLFSPSLTTSFDPVLSPTITTPPHLAHALARRHFYTCGDLTLSWESEWYTQPFFTTLRASFDRAASTGPVNPPLGIIGTVGRCETELSKSGIVLETSTVPIVMTSDGTTMTTSAVSVFSRSAGSKPTATATVTPSDGLPASTTFPSSLSFHTASVIPSSTTTTIPSSLNPTATAIESLGSSGTCAGQWDFQAAGAVSNLLFGVLVGGLIWATWGILRSRIPEFFSPRTWSAPNSSTSSRPWTLLAFLFPFLHLPSLSSPIPLSTSQLSLSTSFTALKIAALSSLVALGAALPLFVAGVPCISSTAPSTPIGHLGSLNDLSLLRLLNALDPSPDSRSASDLLHLPSQLRLASRALSSTIAPAISSARIRLIILLVLITVLSVGGGLFTIARGYAALSKYRKHFQEEICAGIQMVYMPDTHSPGWRGSTEARVKELLQAWSRKHGLEESKEESEKKRGVEIIGVFAIPDTIHLRQTVARREKILDELEVAETEHLRGSRNDPLAVTQPLKSLLPPHEIHPMPTQSSSMDLRTSRLPNPNAKASRHDQPQATAIASSSSAPHETPINSTTNTQTASVGTRFHEIKRDSALFSTGFEIGQRVKLDENGMFIPDPSPDESDETHGSGEGPNETSPSRSRGSSPQSTVSFGPIPETEEGGEVGGDRGSRQAAPSTFPLSASENETGPSSGRRALSTSLPPRSANEQSKQPRPIGFRYHSAIVYSRSEFKLIDNEITLLQKDAFEGISAGRQNVGWIIIGRGVSSLPHAEPIEGYTKEDILWENLGHPSGEGKFWTMVILVGVVFTLVAIPFLGLTVASAPNFALHLPFLEPLAQSGSLAAGLVQGMVPAFVLSLLGIAAVLAVNRLSKRVSCVSRARQRALGYKAAFWLLLVACLLSPVTIAALEFAVDGFVTDVQAPRTVGDGATYSTWFAFVIFLNIAIILPGLLLLQPIRLARYLWSKRRVSTPRRKFNHRLPPHFQLTLSLSPILLAVFYATTLLFLFPLLAIPLLLLLYLTFIVIHHQGMYLHAPERSFEGASLGLWSLRRFGWCLALQPLLFGLILLSRNEWTIGGCSMGIGVITIILSEIVTVVSHRHHGSASSSPQSKHKQALAELSSSMSGSRQGSPETTSASRRASTSSTPLYPRQSTSSMLQRFTVLLPGLSRLPPPTECPVPLNVEGLEGLDMVDAEKASWTRPDLVLSPRDNERSSASAGISPVTGNGVGTSTSGEDWSGGDGDGGHIAESKVRPAATAISSWDKHRGLIYPPEMLLPIPVIWLPYDESGLAEREVVELGRHHHLEAIVDPPETQDRDRDRVCERAQVLVNRGEGEKGNEIGKERDKGKGKEKEISR